MPKTALRVTGAAILVYLAAVALLTLESNEGDKFLGLAFVGACLFMMGKKDD